MANLIAGVKKFSPPMFVVFVASKLLVGLGLGALLVHYLAPYAWWLLIVGVALSLICIVFAFKNG